MQGTIKRLVIDQETGHSKGFGFILAKGMEYFFHRVDVTATRWTELHEGDRVTFTPLQSFKGPRATEVRLLADDTADAELRDIAW